MTKTPGDCNPEKDEKPEKGEDKFVQNDNGEKVEDKFVQNDNHLYKPFDPFSNDWRDEYGPDVTWFSIHEMSFCPASSPTTDKIQFKCRIAQKGLINYSYIQGAHAARTLGDFLTEKENAYIVNYPGLYALEEITFLKEEMPLGSWPDFDDVDRIMYKMEDFMSFFVERTNPQNATFWEEFRRVIKLNQAPLLDILRKWDEKESQKSADTTLPGRTVQLTSPFECIFCVESKDPSFKKKLTRAFCKAFAETLHHFLIFVYNWKE